RRAAAMAIAPWLRRWDVRSSAGVTRFIANSNFVRERIRRYYDRDADVIHPYVDDVFLAAPMQQGRSDEHVIVSALVPYKRIELAIEAARGRRLVVIGGGPLLEEMRARSGRDVEFTGPVPRDTIVARLARARSLLLPGVEDFGITPLEAMALGTPVVALGEGGVRDSVIDGGTGIFFDGPDVQSLRRALDAVESREWDREALRAHASRFSRAHFVEQFAATLQP
ncbi:MAG TPA: glycosyltransferase, partial [Thermoanaerobaculia bacterium]|nr:glycosyltransferase [Thermoanaerobaculia bacterium]